MPTRAIAVVIEPGKPWVEFRHGPRTLYFVDDVLLVLESNGVLQEHAVTPTTKRRLACIAQEYVEKGED